MKKRKKTTTYYPLALKLEGRPALVVGGGKVAERKIKGLLKAGARVRVVAPVAVASVRRWAERGRIHWISRPVRESDLKGAFLAIVATDDASVNKKVSRWAQTRGVWTNVVDSSALCDFISPAIFRTRGVVVAVTTDARDPVLSRNLKNFLKERWGDFLSYRRGL